MSGAVSYLRPNIQFEPLVSRWYAWCHLVAPAPAAFNVVNRHLPAMASYVQSPAMHAAVVRKPAMRGGPFLDLGGSRVDEVRELLEATRRSALPQIAFTEAVQTLDAFLQDRAHGGSMDALYAAVPTPLRGYVELYYDRHHRPDFRFFEPLLYRSELFDPSRQSVVFTPIHSDESRPFIFSTPRLQSASSLDLKLPFASQLLDELFRAREHPVVLGELRERIGAALAPADEPRFAEMFTVTAPSPRPRYAGAGMRIRYFGHGCLLFETAETSILIDPIVSYTYDSKPQRFTYQDLPEVIDHVLITHGHHDHVLLEPLLQLRHKVHQVIVPRNISGALQDPSLKALLQALGFRNVIEVAELDTIEFPGGAITALPFLGEHHDLHVDSKLTYHIRHRERTALCAVDSCNVEPRLYEHIHRLVGDVERLFIGMECDGAPMSWVYGPLLTRKLDRDTDYGRRGRGSNCAEAFRAASQLRCREVYVYAMGDEPWLRHILDVEYTEVSKPIQQCQALLERCRVEGRIAERLFACRELE